MISNFVVLLEYIEYDIIFSLFASIMWLILLRFGCEEINLISLKSTLFLVLNNHY